jgi:lysophospholipase L1-like esterase
VVQSGGCPSSCATGTSTGGKGGTSGPGKGGTGGTATGGSASSQGGQDGGAGTSGTASSPDASVDRAPDTSVPDAGEAGGFCPSDGTACKIMAMGDSITDGVGSSGGGYRVPLFKLALTDSKNVTFVGRNTNGPTSVTVNGQTKQFPQGHEGYSGWTIKDGGGRSGIYTKVDGAMQTNLPHIILLMIGTNDVDINLDLANAPSRLGELLDKMTTDAPKALIVVAKLVPTKDDNENTRFRTYNEGIVAPVQTRAGQGKNIIMVDMYKAFTDNANYKTALMNDNLHPKDAGYTVMAQTWYDAIKQHLH